MTGLWSNLFYSVMTLNDVTEFHPSFSFNVSNLHACRFPPYIFKLQNMEQKKAFLSHFPHFPTLTFTKNSTQSSKNITYIITFQLKRDPTWKSWGSYHVIDKDHRHYKINILFRFHHSQTLYNYRSVLLNLYHCTLMRVQTFPIIPLYIINSTLYLRISDFLKC